MIGLPTLQWYKSKIGRITRPNSPIWSATVTYLESRLLVVNGQHYHLQYLQHTSGWWF